MAPQDEKNIIFETQLNIKVFLSILMGLSCTQLERKNPADGVIVYGRAVQFKMAAEDLSMEISIQ